MLDQEKTKEQLIREINELKERVFDLETFVMANSQSARVPPGANDRLEPSHRQGAAADGFETTQTLYLDQLLTRDITASGSFDIRGDIWATTFGKVLQSLPIPVTLVDLAGKILVFNQAWLRFAPSCPDLTDRDFLELFPKGEMRDAAKTALNGVIDTRRPNVVETGLILGKDPIWSRITFRSIRIVETRAVLALFEDLTNERKQFLAVERQKQVVSEANASLKQEVARRKRVEGMLRKSLDEKELLLREAHHRVNNNLQIMSSLLRLQASKTSEAEQKAALKEAGDRIHSMALVFEKLYRSERVSKLNLKAYVSGLVNYLVQSYDPIGQRVRVLFDIQDVEIDVEIGAIVGLALCELLSNALKHAFVDDGEGRIHLKLGPIGKGRLELVVEDDGVGLPEGVDSRSGSLGLNLVRSLARQLGGSLDIQGGKGARFRLEFNSEAQRPPSVNKI